MSRLTRIPLVAALAAAGALAGLAAAPELRSAAPPRPVDRLDAVDRGAVEALQSLSRGFTAVAGLVTPSVVTITSERSAVAAGQDNPLAEFFNDPRFRQFFGEPLRPGPVRGLGSGVIVREDGYILTNNHVVQGADEITVVLGDETKLPATLVGTDPRTDVAILKVDGQDLPAVTFGDSDGVEIGQWVLAVGSPFSESLRTSVTAGIVSAVGRSGVGLNVYEDFIQTDAPINPGNSGGALVNLDGELIGINTGIATRGGGSNGIGFAIPANMVRDVMTDLITTGRVSRGWLGVSIGDLDQNLAEALGLDDARGALVQAVVDGSPAFEAGVKQGDVVTSVDGKPIRDRRDLQLTVARKDPGSTVDLSLVREGRERRITVELGQFPDEETSVAAAPAESAGPELGLTVEPIDPGLSGRYDLPIQEGVVVTEVESGSAAEEKGVRPGDIVLQVNRQDVGTLRDFRSAIESTEEGKPVLLLLRRGEENFFVALKPSVP